MVRGENFDVVDCLTHSRKEGRYRSSMICSREEGMRRRQLLHLMRDVFENGSPVSLILRRT